MRQMPGNRFTFAVRVSRQIDFFHFFAGVFEFFQNRALAADRDILGIEIILYFYPDLTFRQISDMPH
ncbi:hypothetical protein D3C73_798460 [compost metagenome]